MTLTKRLSLIASLVPDNSNVCDVGTDHAYLPIMLKKGRKARRVIATDIRPLPLENAKKNIALSGVGGIETRLCDGLSSVDKSEADTVIIAGIGGEVISGIIKRTGWLKLSPPVLLILQPTTSPEILRRCLYENGFEISDETAVEENGKIYTVMRAAHTGEKICCPDWFYYIGKTDLSSCDGRLYAEKQYNRLFSCATALQNLPEKKAEYEYYADAAAQIGNLLNKSEN